MERKNRMCKVSEGRAIQTLSGNGLYVTEQVFGAELDIGNFARVPEIVAML